MSRLSFANWTPSLRFPYVRGDESLVVIAEELGQVFSLRARG